MPVMFNHFFKRRYWSKLRMPQYLFALYVLSIIYGLYLSIRIIPIIHTFILSLHEWTLIDPFKPFIGLRNYIDLFHDSRFFLALSNTIFFTLGTVLAGVVISLALALLLNRRGMRFTRLYEVLYFVPVVAPMVSISVVWKWIYDPTYGVLNYLISFFGIRNRAWLLDPRLALGAIGLMYIWKYIGFYMIIFLVGLKNIPEEYYEEAMIDGSGTFETFKSITLPLLKPITLYVVVISTISAFSVFTPVYVMTAGSQGATGNIVRVLVFDIYENGFRFFSMGYASAEAVILLLITAIFSLLEFKAFRFGEE